MTQSNDGTRVINQIHHIFWNSGEQRLRMPFRLLGGIAIWAILGIAVGRVMSTVLTGQTPLFNLRTTYIGQASVSLIDIVVGAVSITFAIYLAARYVDRRWFRDYGLRIDRQWWIDLAFGFGLGGVLMTGIFLFGAVAVAIVLTSGGFALGHATALNATPVSTASIALAGAFLALGYVVTGELAVPIGVHIAWNFFEGNLYGFPISGSTTTSIIEVKQSGPNLVTGGRFGPEAGLVGVVAILLGIGAVLAWARYSRGTADIQEMITTPELRR